MQGSVYPSLTGASWINHHVRQLKSCLNLVLEEEKLTILGDSSMKLQK